MPNALEKSAANQAAVLAAYASCGNLAEAAEAARVPKSTAYWWKRDATFRAGLSAANDLFADKLERMALGRLSDPTGNRGSDVLLMAMLNANRPDKYRPSSAITDDTAAELMAEWRQVRKRNKAEREAAVDAANNIVEGRVP
jgi:hypothetical protein